VRKAAALVLLALLGGACAGNSGDAAPAQPAHRAHRPTSVVIDTFAFKPKVVRVHTGDTVRWTNHDNILHTVTSGTREYDPSDSGRVIATHKDGVFDMPLDGKAATNTYTFATAGSYHYFCDRHPGMEADVEVS
jgi:plastocyanin